MTTTLLALEGATYVLPDGRTLFHDLRETLDLRPTGLVGRNGVGKSVLGRVLAGVEPLSAGRCVRPAHVHYLAQQVDVASGTVAALAGVDDVLGSLHRIESGHVNAADFDTIGTRWNMPQRLASSLVDAGLAHLHADTPVGTLSGGEAMRVALLGARLADADYLILDEPTNHLDGVCRDALMTWLATWRGGLLVISHDRALLDTMDRTLELTSDGLRSYGGGYAFYAEVKRLADEAAARELEQAKAERRRGEMMLREQADRQTRRSARDDRTAATANLPPILLGRRKERSELTVSRLGEQRTASQQKLDDRVRSAASKVRNAGGVVLRASANIASHGCVARMYDVVLPWTAPSLRNINLAVNAGQRIGMIGPNGCGKSTLLKVLAGDVLPVSGTARIPVPFARLDQRLAQLEPNRSVLEQLVDVCPGTSEGELRASLALLGLATETITTPSEVLSGGERLKAALALATLANPIARLLLLDEPTNHLDIPSVRAVEGMLREYAGALIVVSHDMAFLDQICLTHRLIATDAGWRLDTW